MTSRRPALRRRLGILIVTASLLIVALPASAYAASDPDTVVATLYGYNMPTDGDTGGSGTFSLALDASLSQGCFVVDIVLTDIVGDPPTAIDIHDSTTGDSANPGDVVLTLPATVDASGHADGCVAVSPTLIDALLSRPNSFFIDVHTAGFPDGAILGWIEYTYPVGELNVYTKVCPAAIQSVAQLDAAAKASCWVVVLPPDDISGFVPAGYTVIGYAGTATFDYHVTDGKHADATIQNANRGGGGLCNPGTMTCDFSYLPYRWDVGEGSISVTPTVLPSGTRFGTAEAADGSDPGGPIASSIGAGNQITFDTTGVLSASVFVYLFRDADTMAPVVSTPTVAVRSGATFDGSVPVRLSWTGSDAGSGIDHYAVQRSVDGGAWSTVAASLAAPVFDTVLATGRSYRFRVVAYDGAGNTRTSSSTPVQHARALQDSSDSVHYNGGWQRATSASASGGSSRYASTTGATASLTFTGRSIAWVSPIGPGRGSARIYVDGDFVTTVSLQGSSAARQIVFARRFSTVATHTISIKVVGTPGHPRVDLDAFLYLD